MDNFTSHLIFHPSFLLIFMIFDHPLELYFDIFLEYKVKGYQLELFLISLFVKYTSLVEIFFCLYRCLNNKLGWRHCLKTSSQTRQLTMSLILNFEVLWLCNIICTGSGMLFTVRFSFLFQNIWQKCTLFWWLNRTGISSSHTIVHFRVDWNFSNLTYIHNVFLMV